MLNQEFDKTFIGSNLRWKPLLLLKEVVNRGNSMSNIIAVNAIR